MKLVFLCRLSFSSSFVLVEEIIFSILGEIEQLWVFPDSLIPNWPFEVLTNFDDVLIKILTETDTNHFQYWQRQHVKFQVHIHAHYHLARGLTQRYILNHKVFVVKLDTFWVNIDLISKLLLEIFSVMNRTSIHEKLTVLCLFVV